MTNPPTIILSRPQLGENIGAAARAMANFGLSDLRLAAPRSAWPNQKATAMAAGAVALVETARVFPNVRDALADLNLILATTARDRGIAREVLTPAEAAQGACAPPPRAARKPASCSAMSVPASTMRRFPSAMR